MDDNDQQQQDEICALEAIYAENFAMYTLPSFPHLCRKPPNAFVITIPNDMGRSELLLTVHYHKDYPSSCYPKFSVYAEWLSEKQIADIEEKLVGKKVLGEIVDGGIYGESGMCMRIQLGRVAARKCPSLSTRCVFPP